MLQAFRQCRAAHPRHPASLRPTVHSQHLPVVSQLAQPRQLHLGALQPGCCDACVAGAACASPPSASGRQARPSLQNPPCSSLSCASGHCAPPGLHGSSCEWGRGGREGLRCGRVLHTLIDVCIDTHLMQLDWLCARLAVEGRGTPCRRLPCQFPADQRVHCRV